MKTQKKIEIKRNYPSTAVFVKHANMWAKTEWEHGKQKITWHEEKPI